MHASYVTENEIFVDLLPANAANPLAHFIVDYVGNAWLRQRNPLADYVGLFQGEIELKGLRQSDRRTVHFVRLSSNRSGVGLCKALHAFFRQGKTHFMQDGTEAHTHLMIQDRNAEPGKQTELANQSATLCQFAASRPLLVKALYRGGI